MSWQLGLSRFIHGLPHIMSPGCQERGARVTTESPSSRFSRQAEFTTAREEALLPALIMTIFDLDRPLNDWPPPRVTTLIDLAGLDRAFTGLHLQGACLPASFHRGALSRSERHAVLIDGLSALDLGLFKETGACFEELSPTLRGYVLSAFERGELGHTCAAIERFLDCIVETSTFAFLNWELGSLTTDAETVETPPTFARPPHV